MRFTSTAVVALVLALSTRASSVAAILPPGAYVENGHTVYVGVRHDPPDQASNDFFDSASQRTGDLQATNQLHLLCGLSEQRRLTEAPEGKIGFSIYYVGAVPRATVILVHGNDAETREMGFIIPFFACNGINVISYDQRGVGASEGDWLQNGPNQRAEDIEFLYNDVRQDSHVDAQRIGIWAFSNGGWTAPLVSLHRRLAFMILKSAPTESLPANIDYEVDQSMRRYGESSSVPQAVALWHAFESSLNGKQPWSETKRLYDLDAAQSWFRHSLMPDLGIAIPPAPSQIPGLRRFITCDPVPTLLRASSTPTLALYGALDRNVDAADSAAHLREYLRRAGNRDVTVKTYPTAGHQLLVSQSGYNGDASPPERFVPGYPQIMVTWLEQRGFTRDRP